MKKGKKLIILSLLACLLTGCFDLGTFGGNEIYNTADPENIAEYYKAYYDAIGPIGLCKQNKILNLYSLENSFFSKSTVNDLTWEDDDYAVDYNEYIYMSIKVEQDISMDSLSLYMKAEDNGGSVGEITTQIYLYVLNRNIFLSVPDYNDPYYLKDINGNIQYEADGITPIRFSYDFMDNETAVGNATISLKTNEFDSFTIDSFTNGADTKKVEKGQYIILSFYNNTAYGCHDGLSNVSFTALNLLIRAS